MTAPCDDSADNDAAGYRAAQAACYNELRRHELEKIKVAPGLGEPFSLCIDGFPTETKKSFKNYCWTIKGRDRLTGV